jgi:hypothetical protein
MTQAYSATLPTANPRGAETCTISPKNCTVSPLQIAITDIIKRKKPAGSKAWAYLCDLFGIKERSAKSRLSNSVSYTIEELQALLHGDDGLEYLEALMVDAAPPWWAWARWTIEQGNLKRLAVDATQKSLQLESHLPAGAPARRKGNTDVKILSAELARSQTAIGLLDSYSSRAAASAVVATTTQAQAARSSGARR